MTLKRNHWILIALTAVVLLALIFKLTQSDSDSSAPQTSASQDQAQPKAALTVQLVKPIKTLMQATVTANGSVAAWQEAIIGSEVNGLMLSQVLVNVGDTVQRGQLLAQFNASTIESNIAQAQANLSEAKANAIEAASNASRARSIEDSGALSTQTIAQLMALEATSNARVAAAEATLQSHYIQLKQTKVIAPDSGIISSRTATLGAVTSAGQELFKLIRQGRLEWRAELTSSDIGLIKNGMGVQLTLPNNALASGKVRMVSPVVDAQTRNAIVFVDLMNPNQAKLGMFARGVFNVGAADAYTLPADAVIMKDGFAYVMQVDANNRVRQVKVQTGKREAAAVELLGFEAIDADFVASGGAFLADGDLVNVVGRNTGTKQANPAKESNQSSQIK